MFLLAGKMRDICDLKRTRVILCPIKAVPQNYSFSVLEFIKTVPMAISVMYQEHRILFPFLNLRIPVTMSFQNDNASNRNSRINSHVTRTLPQDSQILI